MTAAGRKLGGILLLLVSGQLLHQRRQRRERVASKESRAAPAAAARLVRIGRTARQHGMVVAVDRTTPRQRPVGSNSLRINGNMMLTRALQSKIIVIRNKKNYKFKPVFFYRLLGHANRHGIASRQSRRHFIYQMVDQNNDQIKTIHSHTLPQDPLIKNKFAIKTRDTFKQHKRARTH